MERKKVPPHLQKYDNHKKVETEVVLDRLYVVKKVSFSLRKVTHRLKEDFKFYSALIL